MTFIHFTIDDLDELTQAMDALVAAGTGWVNAMPFDADRSELSSSRSVPGIIFGRLGGRGPATPKITWTAPETRRSRVSPAQLGIEHPAGPRAAARLAEADHPVPPGWLVLQDHAIRGLVLAVAPSVDTPDPASDNPPSYNSQAAVMGWAIGAAELLAGDQGPDWQAQVFSGR